MSELAIWSARQGAWVSCTRDEIIWLDRRLLSEGRDATLHRKPRCPAFRHVQHSWELFSRDITHTVYVAPFVVGQAIDPEAITAAARYVLPAARIGLETQPVRLEAGIWMVAVGKWVLSVRVDGADEGRDDDDLPGDDAPVTAGAYGAPAAGGQAAPPVADAVARVSRYFARNPAARLAVAYHYRDFIRGEFAPQVTPMLDVAIALDLSSEGSVSEYKKELQRRIWDGQGHQRELGKFLLMNGLLGPADLAGALDLAAKNEASGRTGLARERLRYKAKRRAT